MDSNATSPPAGSDAGAAPAARWYFDVISPFAYLQFQQLGRLQERLRIELCPVLFAGLLKHWGQLGPAEIPGKRLHTYRLCTFLAHSRGLAFRMPPRHPFNPLPALRLMVALGATIPVVKAVFDFVFAEGGDVGDPAQMRELAARLGVADLGACIDAPEVKQRLLDNTGEAAAQGVFGVPTTVYRGELFWGDDSLAMLEAFLREPLLFEQGEMRRLSALPIGQARRIEPARSS